MNTAPNLDNHKRELEVIGKDHDLLRMGWFNGSVAQDVTVCQIYMQSLYKNLKAEIERLQATASHVAQQGQESSAKAQESQPIGCPPDNMPCESKEKPVEVK